MCCTNDGTFLIRSSDVDGGDEGKSMLLITLYDAKVVTIKMRAIRRKVENENNL